MPCWALLRSVFVSLKKASVWSNMANLSDSANCILKRILNWRCWEKVYFSSKPPVLVKIKVCGMRIFFSGKMRLFILVFSGAISYGSDRIKYWLDPWADPSGSGYQTIQSLLAIGSGGPWGRGIGQSRQKYLWVPEPHNDFIFSIVCEELGYIGAMVIIVLFCALVWRGFTIAMRSQDKFGSLLAIGLTFQVGLQAILNILVITNTIPNTGISLPFFSYGGTALVILLAEMGVVLSVSRSSSIEKL